MRHLRLHHRECGTTIIEVLVALLVLSLGAAAVATLQHRLRLNANLAEQRSEAVRIAQSDIEAMRAQEPTSAPPASIAHSDADLADPSQAAFQVDRTLREDHGLRTVDVGVSWTDPAGQAQKLRLTTAIATVPFAFSGALSKGAGALELARVGGRSPRIPPEARRMADGRSVFRPRSDGTVAWIFDDASGLVVSRCGLATTTSPLSSSPEPEMGNCIPVAGGMLLSGIVRQSLAVPPDPSHASEMPLPLEVDLDLLGGPYPTPAECISEAQMTVALETPAGEHLIAVPVSATPASLGASSWTKLGDRFVAYHCVVTPIAGRWSGRSRVVPHGWSVGLSASERKVCRYTTSHHSDGAVATQNAAHPDTYHDVDGPLMQQNFLLVRGDQACPSQLSDQATVQHQP